MIASLAKDVENAVALGDPVARVTMLRRMTGLFLDTAERLGEEQVFAFDTVIHRLAQSVESQARAALSESFADVANAPRKVVRDLAYDEDAAVAGPVLTRSTRIQESDLVTIANERGQDHLFALSRRRTLSERVTDVLVVRGNQEVVRSVASNEGARFSETGLDTLVRRAEDDDDLQNALTLRRDIPAAHMAHLVATAEARVARKLKDEFGAEAADRAVASAARTLTGNAQTLQEAIASVDAHLAACGTDQPTEREIAAWLGEGRVTEALVGLARAAGVTPDMVMRADQGAHYDPVLFLIRSVRYGWGTFKLVLTSKPGPAPTQEVMRGAFEAFQALSVATAQRVVRFTVARDTMEKAS